MAEVDPLLGAPLAEPWLAFVNINNRDDEGDPLTPGPGTNVQAVYLVNPRSGQRVAVLEMPASTDDRVFWAPTGERFAYFVEAESGADTGGLYVFDLTIGVSSRILRLESLVQRGFYTLPVWSPDGQQLVIAAANGYEIDIYRMNADGTDLQNLTAHGAYDFWPAWSPDGRYIAFVSDRAACPDWSPAGNCADEFPNGPDGGSLYLLDTANGDVRQISDAHLTEPPRWITPAVIGFTTGSYLRGDDFRSLWQVDIASGNVRQIALSGETVNFYLAESWSPDGSSVIFQQADETMTAITLMTSGGDVIDRSEDYTFARFAFRAAWSPDGTRLAIGGHGGQCPYGLVVLNADFSPISRANPPPTACDPEFSPDGLWIAYAGINPNIDGRLDVYIANASGYSTVNYGVGLRGQIRILGWVGGVPAAPP